MLKETYYFMLLYNVFKVGINYVVSLAKKLNDYKKYKSST